MHHDSSDQNKLTERVLFEKRPGTSDSGHSYEIHLLMLLLLRGIKKAETFYLGTNIKEAGAFDDIVFQCVYKDKEGKLKSKLVFLQAKHKESAEKHIIKEHNLLSDKGDFCLNKYFNSYLEIKELIESSQSENSNFAKFIRNWKTAKHEFLIYTNTSIDPGYEKSDKWLQRGKDKFLTSENSLGSSKVMQLDKRYNDLLAKSFSGEFQYMNDKRSKRSYTAKEITDFFTELKFFIGQSNVNSLEEIIKCEIISYYDVTEEDSAFIYLQVKEKIESWCKNHHFFLTEIDDYFEMGRQNIFKLQLEKFSSIPIQKKLMEVLDIEFKEDGLEKIRKQINQYRVINFLVQKGCVSLSSIKLFQVVNGIPEYHVDNDRVLFVRLKDFPFSDLRLLQALKFNEKSNLLLIECEMIAKNPIETDHLFSLLHEIIIATSDKKVILITEENNCSMKLFENDHVLKDKFISINDSVSFFNLTEETKLRLMKFEVTFQGQKISLNELFYQNADLASEIIDLETLLALTQNDSNLHIGVDPKRMHDLESAYGRIYEDISFTDLIDNVIQTQGKNIVFMISFTEHSHNITLDNENHRVIKEILSNVEENCVLSTDSTNLLKQINNVGNITTFIVEANDCTENLLKTFKLICGMNSDKIVYWVDVASNQVRIQQIYDPNFYLSRQLKYFRNVWINQEKILKQLTTPNSFLVFIFSGVADWNEFKRLFSKMDLQHNLVNDEKIQLFVSEIEAEQAFQTFHEQGLKVHWLKVNTVCCHKKIIWQQSNCSLNVIQQCINNNSDDYENLEEAEFITRVKDRVVIIADEPGMGKSTTLTSLCNQMLATHVLININIKNCKDAITSLPIIRSYEEMSVEVILNFLSNLKSLFNISNLTKNWLKCSLTQKDVSEKRPVLFLFDGFDEISNDLQEKIIPLLQFLKYKTLATLWVTTRRHKQESLENSLAAFVTNFEKVSSHLQNKFLTNFWLVRLTLLKTTHENMDIYLSKLSNCCNLFLKKNCSILGQETLNIMGVPLKLRLLAEGYTSEVAQFLKAESNETYFTTFEHLDLLTIYQRFVDAKYKIYFKEKTQLDNCSDYIKFTLKQRFDKDHQRLALKVLFSNQDFQEVQEIFTGNRVMLTEVEPDNIISLGIIESIDTTANIVNFTHLTFAEYFTAMLFAQFLNDRQDKFESTKHFLGNILKNSNNNYEVVHKFINHMLSRGSLLRTTVLNNNHSKLDTMLKDHIVEDSSDILGRTAVHLAVINCNIGILKKLLHAGLESVKQDVFGKTPLHYSFQYKQKEITKYLLNFNADIDIDNNLVSKPLLLETVVGDTVFIKPGFENSNLFKFINIKDVHYKTPLEYAIEIECLDIACLLLLYGACSSTISQENKMKLFSYAAYKAVPGYSKYHELSPVLALLAIKANREVFDERGDGYNYPRLLSYFCKYGHIKVIDAVLKTIQNPVRRLKLLNYKDNSVKPLLRVDSHVLQNDEIYLQAIKYLLEKGATGNYDSIKRILLSAAAIGHLETLKYFLRFEDTYDVVRLLYEASRRNNLIIVEYLWNNYLRETTDECDNTALHAAACIGTMTCLKYLIENGADVNATNDKGKTPLHFAAAESRFDVIKYLMDKGANVNAVDNSAKSVLDYAIDAYINPDWNGHEDHIKKGENFSILKYLLVNFDACFLPLDPFTTNIKMYFRTCDTFDLNYEIEQEIPRLHWAIQNNEIEWAKFLIRQGADVNEPDRTSERRTVLHWAIVHRNLPIVKILLQYGAVYDKKDASGRTPLNLCESSSNHMSWIMQLLHKLFNSDNLMGDLNENLQLTNTKEPYRIWIPDVYDPDNPTLLFLNAHNILRTTLLHVAAKNNDFEAAKFLLSFNQQYLDLKFQQNYVYVRDYKSININAQDLNGNTPLHLAAKHGYYEVLVLLLQEGAFFNCKNQEGNTPERLAENEGFQNVVICLQQIQNLFVAVEQGITIEENFFDRNNSTHSHAKDQNGKTLLHVAVCNNHVDNTKFLIKSGSDIEATDAKNCTPLHYAAENGFSEIIVLLLREGCIFNAKNSEGKTPMDVFKITQIEEANKMLQDINTIFSDVNEQGMTVLRLLQSMKTHNHENLNSVLNCKDEEGNTLLHLASKNGYFDLVLYILGCGATYNEINKRHQTPQQYATDSKIKHFLGFIDDLFSWNSHLNYTLEEIKEAGQLKIIQSVRDIHGKTILHYAVDSNYYRIKFLESNS